MKRWQILTLVIVGILLVGGLGGGTYYLIAGQQMPDQIKATNKTTTKSEDEKELDSVKTEVDQDSDLDMTELDSVTSELEAIDLSEV